MTNPILPKLLVWALLILVPGCASLPDFKRVEGATDAMAHYSGVMAGGIPAVAHSMTRISHTADRVRRKTDRELDTVSKATYKVEPSVKTYLDSKHGGTDNLKGIHQELRELRETLGGLPAPPKTDGEMRLRDKLNARVRELESQMEAVSTRLERSRPSRQ